MTALLSRTPAEQRRSALTAGVDEGVLHRSKPALEQSTLMKRRVLEAVSDMRKIEKNKKRQS